MNNKGPAQCVNDGGIPGNACAGDTSATSATVTAITAYFGRKARTQHFEHKQRQNKEEELSGMQYLVPPCLVVRKRRGSGT